MCGVWCNWDELECFPVATGFENQARANEAVIRSGEWEACSVLFSH